MTAEQRVECIRNHTDEAKNMAELWKACRPMVRAVASRFRWADDDEDLMQQSFLGICKAVEMFDPDRDTSFTHYASFWVRRVLMDYVRKQSLSLPGSLKNRRIRCRTFYKRVKQIEAELGRTPSDQEIRELTGVTREYIDEVRTTTWMISPVSLDAPAGAEADCSLGDLQPDPADPYEDVLDRYEQEQLRAVLWPRVDTLPPNQRDLLRLRYQEGLTLEQIGEIRGVTKQAVSSAVKRALESLRRDSKLKNFMKLEAAAYNGTGLQSFRRTWTSAPERIAIENTTL